MNSHVTRYWLKPMLKKISMPGLKVLQCSIKELYPDIVGRNFVFFVAHNLGDLFLVILKTVANISFNSSEER